MVVLVSGKKAKQVCPACGHESGAVHSTYLRKLRDLPVQGRSLRVHAVARRWRCLNRECRRVTFCESFEGLAKRHAQRTERMSGTMEHYVLTVGSNAAAHLLKLTGVEVSGRTLLRVVDHGEADTPTPRVVGVDDFALRKGRTYGTVLVDLEKGKPIGILPGRNKEPLQGWLKDRPGIEIVARDRASAYADAATEGAPQAIQVADRFHLVKNVTEALKEVVDRQTWALPEPAPLPVSDFVVELAPEPKPVSAPQPPKRMNRAERRKAAAAGRLQRRYEEVHRLRRSGMSVQQIREATGMHCRTIKKYLGSSEVPKRAAARPRPNPAEPFADYLQERWENGCHNAQALYAELVQQGFTGSLPALRRFLQPWRAECPPKQPKERLRTQRQKPALRPTWKEARTAILCLAEHLKESQRLLLQELLALHPSLKLAHGLVQQFRDLVRNQDPSALDNWFAVAAESGLAPFERLARTLTADRAAVLAGITLPWSTGPVEGQITRVKLIKRIGYGRASLPLLRARVLYSAQRENRPKTRKRSRKGASQHAVA